MDLESRKVLEMGYGGAERLTMNMGPQHPSSHGVFRAILTLEGETVVAVDAVIGYRHRCHEKLGESLTYTQYPSIASKTDYVAAMTSELAYVRAAEMIGKIDVPGGTQGIAVSPDGTQVIIMASAEATALVVDPKSDKIVDRVALKDQKGGSYKVYYSPDGKYMLTMNLGSTLINIFDAKDLHAPQRTATCGKDPMGIAFSADGKTALVANHGDGSVSVIDLVKMETINTFKAGTGIETLTYY